VADGEPPKRLKPKRPAKVPVVPMPPGCEPKPEITSFHASLIGRVVSEWSKLEHSLDDLIWTLTGLSFEDGRVLTSRNDAKSKISILQVLAPRYLDGADLQKIDEALVMADFLRDDRNFIMHGSWGTIQPIDEPIALSLRAKSLPGEVTGETFPQARMVEIIDRIIQTKETIFSVVRSLESSKGLPSEPNRTV
jgi:hypothetical protein